MLKFTLHRIHRWIGVAFALPLALMTVTGLILSVEAITIDAALMRAPVSQSALEAALAAHDPQNKATALTLRPYDGTLSLGSRGDMIHVDLASNARIAAPGAAATAFALARRLHENFLGELDALTAASAAAMLALIGLGVAMGAPRLRNSVSGWHKGAGWLLLPLLALIPLTGLLMWAGVTFTPPLPRPAGPPPTLKDAVRVLAQTDTLGGLVSLRMRGGAMTARIDDGGEMRMLVVGRDGVTPAARNWPRLLHEGNWARIAPALLNAVAALGFTVLLVTGMWLWARRTFRRRPTRLRASDGRQLREPFAGPA